MHTALITGCTKGSIGYSLAKEFAERGYHVYATARCIESMGDLSLISNITLLSLDVTSRESVEAAYAKISKETSGKLDILYHNAGYRSLAMSIESSPEEAYKMFNTNLFGIILLNNIFGRMLIKSKGKIVFTGSVSGYTPHPSQGVYNSTKAAVELYAKTLRLEMRPFGVKVIVVLTGLVSTGMSSARAELAESKSEAAIPLINVIFAELAQDSSYRYLEQKMDQAWAEMESGGMKPHEYAEKVVSKVIRSNPPEEIWCGGGVSQIWIVERLGIRWVYDIVFSRMFGLNQSAPFSE